MKIAMGEIGPALVVRFDNKWGWRANILRDPLWINYHLGPFQGYVTKGLPCLWQYHHSLYWPKICSG